jgi:hypothetical protein
MNLVYSTRNKDKRNALVAGVFYLLAAAASIVALSLYKPILFNGDYLIQGARNANQIILGAFLELITVSTVAGTAIMLFPYLRKFNESLSMGYLCFRLLEAILILVGVLSVLSLLTLSQAFSDAISPDIATYKTTGSVLKAIHGWTFMLGPNFMLGINTFLYSLIFHRTKLVPRKISMIGIAGAILIFIASVLEMFGIFPQLSVWGALFAIPVFVFEMTLAIWLIVRGFNLAHLTK